MRKCLMNEIKQLLKEGVKEDKSSMSYHGCHCSDPNGSKCDYCRIHRSEE